MAKIIYIPAKYQGKIELSDEIITHLKNHNVKNLALFTSIQFLELKEVMQQLKKENIKVNLTKAERTSSKNTQLLGCDVYETSFKQPIIKNSDEILYIGDGLFHPKAILYSQIYSDNPKPIIVYNPASKQIHILTKENIAAEIRKLEANIRKYIMAQNIGILVTTKPGQAYLNSAQILKQKLEKQGKKAFIFISDAINLNELENFPFINAWVNTACPRIGLDDLGTTNQTLINIKEALAPIKYLEKLHKN